MDNVNPAGNEPFNNRYELVFVAVMVYELNVNSVPVNKKPLGVTHVGALGFIVNSCFNYLPKIINVRFYAQQFLDYQFRKFLKSF